MPRQVARRTAGAARPPRTGLAAKTLQYLSLRAEAKALEARANTLKVQMMETLQLEGEVDDRGHQTLRLEQPVEVDGKTYTQIKRERRVSQRFDEEVAEHILRSHGLLERATKTIEVLDQDEVYVLNQEGLLPDDELDSMFNENESFAFKTEVG